MVQTTFLLLYSSIAKQGVYTSEAPHGMVQR